MSIPKLQSQARITLARPLDAYFAAKNRQDTAAMLACFATGAIVVDESTERRGTSAIHQWIESSTRKYRVSVELLDADERDGGITVTGLVSGDFPGSPVTLRYAFTLSDAGIVRLEITS